MSNFWEDIFNKEFVATGADIEGMKRVEYRQLREHQVEQIKSFISQEIEKARQQERSHILALMDELGFHSDEIHCSCLANLKSKIREEDK